MKNHRDIITRKQEQAIAALLKCDTLQEAAKTAGIGLRTLNRWLKEPAFAEIYRNARRDVLKHAISRLSQAADEAVHTLRTVSTNEENPTAARVTAARAIIDQALRAYELEDLDVRITRLEELDQQSA